MLSALPLEELAINMFPDGATYHIGIAGQRAPWKASTEDEVLDRIHELKTSYRVSRFYTALRYRASDRSFPWVHGRLRSSVFMMFDNHEEVTFESDSLSLKPFLIKLPTWLSFRHMYDAVDFGHSLADQFQLALDTDGQSLDGEIWIDRHDAPSPNYSIGNSIPLWITL